MAMMSYLYALALYENEVIIQMPRVMNKKIQDEIMTTGFCVPVL